MSRQLLKLTVESALKAELDAHLGYERHAPAGRGSGNSRNGYSGKMLKGDLGEVPIQTPRDRNGSFEPQRIAKGQPRLARLDSQILALYAKGMTTRDIADILYEVSGTEVSPTLVAKVTDAVWDTAQTWQSQPAGGGLSDKDRRAVVADLKRIYQATTVAEAERALETLAEHWDGKYPSLSQLWVRHWEDVITVFDYPEDIRRVIYTTNAIESLNNLIHKAINNRRIFPSDCSALKAVCLAIEQAARKWTMPIQDWKRALNRFAIIFEGRLPFRLYSAPPMNASSVAASPPDSGGRRLRLPSFAIEHLPEQRPPLFPRFEDP